MTIKETRYENLKILIQEAGGKTIDLIKTASDKGIKINDSYISQILTGVKSASGTTKGVGNQTARKLEDAMGKDEGWMDVSHTENSLQIHESPAIYSVQEASQGDEVYEINYMEAKGSCGGGAYSFEDIVKGKLIKEAAFFKKYNVRPENVIAVYADGDSNAEFIVDGDIMLFDSAKTQPVSGKLFLINHPEGLRVKVLRQNFDKSWSLESKNPDKQRYPTEQISESQAQDMVILGEFFYRQGG